MTPVGPLSSRRLPPSLRRQLEVAAATAWEALVEVHSGHALRFIALMSDRLDFDAAVGRYLDEMDLRDPMASAIRSRVLVAVEDALEDRDGRPTLPRPEAEPGEAEEGKGLRRFRPDRVVEGIARRVRAAEAVEQWVALAVARAEEGVVRAHVDNALVFAALLRDHRSLNDAVEDYLEVMRVSGGRAQSVHQRAMAKLADLHLGDDPNER